MRTRSSRIWLIELCCFVPILASTEAHSTRVAPLVTIIRDDRLSRPPATPSSEHAQRGRGYQNQQAEGPHVAYPVFILIPVVIPNVIPRFVPACIARPAALRHARD